MKMNLFLIESIFARKYPDKPIYIVYPDPNKLELVFQQRHKNGYGKNN